LFCSNPLTNPTSEEGIINPGLLTTPPVASSNVAMECVAIGTGETWKVEAGK